MVEAKIHSAAGATTGFWYVVDQSKLTYESRTEIRFTGTVSEGRFAGKKLVETWFGRFDTKNQQIIHIDKIIQTIGGKTHTSLAFDPAIADTGPSWEAAFADGFTYRGNSFSNDLVADSGHDRLYGGGGNDTLDGLDGDDRLDGGRGADRMKGGLGDDLYHVDATGDVVIEKRDAGTDTVRSTISYVLPSRVERLILDGDRGLKGTGNSLDNRITGNEGANRLLGKSGDDLLRGGGGDDRLDGGAGHDILRGGSGDDVLILDIGDGSYDRGPDGGPGTDTASFAGADHPVFVSPIGPRDAAWLVIGANGELRMVSIETIIAGNFDDRISGRPFADRLFGKGGDDRLDGAGGADSLFGGGGNDALTGGSGGDRMEGGRGNDVYSVDNSRDMVIEKRDAGTDTVHSTISYALPGRVERLILDGNRAISGTGNALDNRITGNDRANRLFGENGDDRLNGGGGADRLDGGRGADRMAGGRGDDTYHVDNAGDLTIEQRGAGTDTVRSTITLTLAAEVEALVLSGDAAIDGTGNDLSNRLSGNGAANRLDGGAGNDDLRGKLGTDTLHGDTGADTFVFRTAGEAGIGASRDAIVDFAWGEDLIDISRIDACTLSPGDQEFWFIGTAAFSGTTQELRYADGIVAGDANGDGLADFEIAIVNLAPLAAEDFLL